MNVCRDNLRISGRLVRVAALAAEGFEYLEDPIGAVRQIHKIEERIDLFTFNQTLANKTVKYGYAMEWDNVAALPVTSFDHWWKCQVTDKTRNMVRRAEKNGVVVQEVIFDESLVSGIHSIYNESSMRQGKPFWHYGEDHATIREENATFGDRSVFLGAFCDDSLIGFAKLTWDAQGVQAGLMQILSMIKYRDKAPTNALIAQAVRSCASRGINYITYGKLFYGNKGSDGLSSFKHHNGFRAEEIPRYYVPLTLMGRIALSLGLHRKMREKLPKGIVAQLQRLRTQWYAFTQRRSKEAL